VGLAVREAAAHGRPARLDPVRLDAEPVQPDAARRGTRDVRPARRSGRRQHPVEPTRQGPPGQAVGHADASRRHRPARRTAVRRRQRRAHRDAGPAVAEARGVPMAQVALAWVLHNPVVAAPIVGPSKPNHLPTPSPPSTAPHPGELTTLESVYTPPPTTASDRASTFARRWTHDRLRPDRLPNCGLGSGLW
jgi:hypothetical protein